MNELQSELPSVAGSRESMQRKDVGRDLLISAALAGWIIHHI